MWETRTNHRNDEGDERAGSAIAPSGADGAGRVAGDGEPAVGEGRGEMPVRARPVRAE